MKRIKLYKRPQKTITEENSNDLQKGKNGDKRFYSPHFDVLGSYTGSGLDPMDIPEQDSDDL